MGNEMLRKCLIGAVVANVGILVATYVALPPFIAVLFGWHGYSTIWIEMVEYGIAMFWLMLMGLLTVYALPWLVLKAPPILVSLPNKHYWLDPQRKTETARKLTAWMEVFGVGCYTFSSVIMLLILHANKCPAMRDYGLKMPCLNLTVFFAIVGIFVAFLLWWVVYSHWIFRLPKEKHYES